MIDKQVKQKTHHDGQKPLREFTVNDMVYVENFPTKKPRWILGTTVKEKERTYRIIKTLSKFHRYLMIASISKLSCTYR